MMDLALDPHFDENKLIYFTYDKPGAPENTAVRTLARGRWTGTALVEVRDLWQQALEDKNPAASMDEILERLEHKYQALVDAAS